MDAIQPALPPADGGGVDVVVGLRVDVDGVVGSAVVDGASVVLGGLIVVDVVGLAVVEEVVVV